MEQYKSEAEYINALEARSLLPEGFRCSTELVDFFPEEKPVEKPYRMNLSLIALDQPSPLFGAVFTKNAFPGAPIKIGREILKQSTVKGVLINNKVANVGAQGGRSASQRLLDRLAGLMGGSIFFPASTGVIGWKLPVEQMLPAIPSLVEKLNGGSVLPVAKAIMTTDAFPKVRCVSAGEGRIVGIAKGAGMIEPNMATMLVFLLTDISIPRGALRRLLRICADETFNRITVDGDQSTSDAVYLFSSGRKAYPGEREFRKGLLSVCGKLAGDIVRNGEGTTHVIRTTVREAPNKAVALGAARNVVNSPLVKTAIFGNDPNVGRLLSSLGDYFGSINMKLNLSYLSVAIGGVTVFDNGSFTINHEKEISLSQYLEKCGLSGNRRYPAHDRTVDIEIGMGRGNARATLLGSDLSCGYVKENAEYRS